MTLNYFYNNGAIGLRHLPKDEEESSLLKSSAAVIATINSTVLHINKK